MRSNRVLIGLVIAVIGAAYYFCNTQENPVTGEKQHVALSPSQEVALGLQAAPEMAQEFGGLYPDEEVQGYVKKIGRDVVARSKAKGAEYPYDFHLLRDPRTVNAFALPGGQIFVTAALLRQLNDEAQLAGVLGHEVGHVVGRHSAEHLAKQQFTQILVGAAGVAGSGDDRGQQTAAIAALIGSMVNLRFSRKDELEADQMGVHFMSEATYDPRAMGEVMEILKRASGGSSPRPEFLSTHPDPGNRLEIIRAEIARVFPNGVPEGLTRGSGGEFERVATKLRHGRADEPVETGGDR